MNYLFIICLFVTFLSCTKDVSSIDRWDSFSYGLNEYIEDCFSTSLKKNEVDTNNTVLQLFMSLDTSVLKNRTDTKLFDREIKKVFLKSNFKDYLERTKVTFKDQNYSLNSNFNLHAFPYYLYRYDEKVLAIVTGYPVKLALNISNINQVEGKSGINLKSLIVKDYTILWKEVTPNLNTLIKNKNEYDSLTLEELRYIDSLDNHK